jgi:hypothetical protein
LRSTTIFLSNSQQRWLFFELEAQMSNNPLSPILNNFSLAKYRLTFLPQEKLLLPAHNKGNTLRGAFGSIFKNIVCIDYKLDCYQCSLAPKCVYQLVFQSQVPPNARRLRKNQDIPRPFIIKPALETKKLYLPDEPLVFQIVLVGLVTEYLPYFLVTFREMGLKGFGLSRAKAHLAKVEAYLPELQEWQEIYRGSDGLVKNLAAVWSYDQVCSKAQKLPKDSLTIQFLTPTRLVYNKQIVHQPKFHYLIKRLRDRINALAVFYCQDELKIDHKAFGQRAEQVKTIAQHTFWKELSRYSSKRKLTQDLSGFMGWVTYEGPLEEFLPFLLIGEWIHVGKAALWGNGWLQIQP